MIELSSAELAVRVAPRGAEIQSVRERSSGHEYLWQNTSEVWSGPAPVLFPVIGSVHDRKINVDGRPYPMPQHGFVRSRDFSVVQQTSAAVTLRCSGGGGDDATFPYPYQLEISYELRGRELAVAARVHNPGDRALPFSLGFHPGFNASIPASPDGPATSRLEIESAGPLIHLPRNEPGGFLTGERRLWSASARMFPLTRNALGLDAIVLAAHAPLQVTLVDDATKRRVTLRTASPFFGIWSKAVAEAQFVCLEPWWGTTDPVASYDDFRAKPHLQHLAPGATFPASFTLSFQ